MHFGDVPIAEVFDLKGFNLNAKLDIDPEFLKADDARHDHHDHDHETTITSTASTATIRTTTPTTTT